MPRTSSSAAASQAVGRAIRSARQTLGVTQAELARRLQTTAPYVSSVEAGRSNMTVGQVWAVAEALEAELHVELRPVRGTAPTIAAPPR